MRPYLVLGNWYLADYRFAAILMAGAKLSTTY
jgi:hypothetical protein